MNNIITFNYTHDDYERAKDKARQLLRSILSESDWNELENTGKIRVVGERYIYVISPYSQTELRDKTTGLCVGYSCMKLSVPAPTYDRMIAEYLVIKNAEPVYLKTANLFMRHGNEIGIASLFLIAFNIALFINIVLDLLS